MEALRERGIHLLAITLLLVALFSVLRMAPGKGITGLVTFGTQEEVLGEIEAMTRIFEPLRFAGEGANLCMLIDLGFDSSYAYQLRKSNDAVTISPVRQWDCGGSSDFILKFISYGEFKRFAQNPSCGAFLAGGRGEQFWYLPSRLWPAGDSPSCTAEFQQRYCPTLYYCGEPAELSPALSCCSVDRLTPEQRALAAAAVDSGVAAQERGTKSAVLETPLGNVRALLSWGLGMLVILGLILGTLILLRKGKAHKVSEGENETIRTLRTYIQDMKRQGFSEAEIAHELRSKGWAEDMVDANLHEGLF